MSGLCTVATDPRSRMGCAQHRRGVIALDHVLARLGYRLVSTFMISHLELFGLTQVWNDYKSRPMSRAGLQVRFLYRFVRHPIMLGFLIAFWSTPLMTQGHLMFAVMTTGYIIVGVLLEERDLVDVFGSTYARYRDQVPMLIPFLKRGGGVAAARKGDERDFIAGSGR